MVKWPRLGERSAGENIEFIWRRDLDARGLDRDDGLGSQWCKHLHQEGHDRK